MVVPRSRPTDLLKPPGPRERWGTTRRCPACGAVGRRAKTNWLLAQFAEALVANVRPPTAWRSVNGASQLAGLGTLRLFEATVLKRTAISELVPLATLDMVRRSLL